MKPFKFKEFAVHQDQCAMKIGTDGVLLGSWASIGDQTFSILDIGAGTGVIALMLAQRSRADTIEAIELDEAAFQQCTENFEDSIWADRLFCFHAGFDEFVAEYTDENLEDFELYDLIVSNPPFYKEEVASAHMARDLARQYLSLPFEELVSGVGKLLSSNGVFSTIIPYKEETSFIALAKKSNLFPLRITRVRGNKDAEIKRSLLEFSFANCSPIVDELTIEIERNRYTPEYIELTKAFYLKM